MLREQSHLLQPGIQTQVCLEPFPHHCLLDAVPQHGSQMPSASGDTSALDPAQRINSSPPASLLWPGQFLDSPSWCYSPPPLQGQRVSEELQGTTFPNPSGPRKNSSELLHCRSDLRLWHVSGNPCLSHLPTQTGSFLRLRLGASAFELKFGYPILCNCHGQHQYHDHPHSCLQSHLLWPATPPPAQPPQGVPSA